MPESRENQKEHEGDADQVGSDAQETERPDDEGQKSYYYDDAHGYEEFDPESED